MARKILVDLTNSLGTFVQKTNAMSDYMGDLDDFNPRFAANNTDSNIVSVINFLDSQLQTVLGDSAGFKYINVDSADFNALRAESAYINTLNFDSLYGGDINADSIYAHFLRVDSAYISHLSVDSAYIDSATIVRLRGDSISYKYATFNQIDLESDRLIFDEWSITEESADASGQYFPGHPGKRLLFNRNNDPVAWFDSAQRFLTRDIMPVFDSNHGWSHPTGAYTSHDIGASNREWRAMYAIDFIGTALRAKWADLAENYLCDEELEVGTVVAVGGSKEITKGTYDRAHSVIGVVSEKPAILMNQNLIAGKGEFVVPVALKGRVQVKVSGTVYKGDRLIPTDNGIAMANNNKNEWSFAVALEDNKFNTVEAIIL